MIEWRRQWPEPVVWVSVAKLDKSWQLDGSLYVTKEALGNEISSRSKYKRFGEFFREGHPLEMPHIGTYEGHVSFTNGRHRFAWLRDHGVRALPVTTDPALVAEFKHRFGTRSRVSRLPTTRRISREGVAQA